MTATSGAAPPGSTDIRDALGYAIREIDAGVQDASGNFHDLIAHKPGAKQTAITVSSTDPWHRETDRDNQVEQPGFDMLVQSGLTNNLPMLIPVAVVYDTPENAAAEVTFLKSRGYKVPRIEMGEECDGQKMNPVDYGALYIQWAGAIHKVAPDARLGGPCFVTIDFDKSSPGWTYGNGWWIRHFLDYLDARRHRADFTFLSFEWYPFDEACDPCPPQLLQAPTLLRNAMELIRKSGVTAQFPIVVSEYGYSAFDGRAEVDLPGALLNADFAALFLTLGGETSYLYGYEPNCLENNLGCSWGNNMLFLQNAKGGIRAPMATFYAAQMLTRDWLQPSGGLHEVYPARSDILDPRGQEIVTAYALKRPDKSLAVLLINKDPAKPREVRLRFQKSGHDVQPQPAGPYDLAQFSPAQYHMARRRPQRPPIPQPPARASHRSRRPRPDFPAPSLFAHRRSHRARPRAKFRLADKVRCFYLGRPMGSFYKRAGWAVFATLFFAAVDPASAKKKHHDDSTSDDTEYVDPQTMPEVTTFTGTPSVHAASVMVIDAKTGHILYEKNPDERRPPASTQKLLTSLIIAGSGDLGRMVTVEPSDTWAEPVKLNFQPGEHYSRYQLLQVLLVHSTNDVARCLARDNAGSIEAFADKMNQKAAELGATNSHFVNPNGLPVPGQYSCARDMARIAQAAYANPLIRSIVCLKSLEFHYADGRIRDFKNTNKVLRGYALCNGMKTGYTEAAGHCLIASGANGGHDIIVVVLGDNGQVWKDAYLLLAWGLASASG